MSRLIQTLFDGAAVGSFYALIALGYTMVYGILKFINFAHSDVFTWGAWISLLVAVKVLALGVHPLIAGPLVMLTVMLACGLLGFVIERVAYKPLRGAPRLNALITAIGVSLLLQNVGQLRFIFGTQPQRMPELVPDIALTTFAGVPVRLLDVLGLATALVLMLALEWLIFRTRTGRAMRAVSVDPRVASLMGVNVDRVIAITFVLGSALAAAAGFLYSLKYPGLNQPAHATWVLLGLKAFVAAVFGGIGNVRGAMLGGLLIGLIEFLSVAYVGDGLAWMARVVGGASIETQISLQQLGPKLKDVYVFALLIIILLVQPNGILGRSVAEKV